MLYLEFTKKMHPGILGRGGPTLSGQVPDRNGKFIWMASPKSKAVLVHHLLVDCICSYLKGSDSEIIFMLT